MSISDHNLAKKSEQNLFDFRDFRHLDESPDVDYLVDSMERMYEIEKVSNIKENAIEMLGPKSGDNVLDIGCGLGFDVELIHDKVGESGHVTGIDASAKMINRANQRFKHSNVEFINGIVPNAQFDTGSFDGVYADRLLVSQASPEDVVHEMKRLVRVGGKVCVTDVDFGSIIFYPDMGKLGQILFERLQEILFNPNIGRELPHIFKRQGFADIKVIPQAYLLRNYDYLNTMIDFPRIINDLYTLGRYSAKEADTIAKGFRDAQASEDFLYSIILFTVCGTKS